VEEALSNPTWPPPYSLLQCLDRLPARARRKYDDLKALLADAEHLQRSLQERVRAKEERLADLTRRREYASVPGGVAAEVAKLDRELSAVRADLDRLERERSRRNGVRANTEQVVSRLDNFILQLFSGASDATPPRWPATVPGARAGESVGDAVLRLRREINIAQGELRQIKTAPPPAIEIRAALVAEVDRMAAEGKPRVSVDGGKIRIHWPDVQPYAAHGAALSAPSGSASKMLCALFGDQLKTLLAAGVDDVKGAVPGAERPKRVREVEARILALEVAEERLVVAALEEGLEVHRRPDASPWAILYADEEAAAVAEAAE
jgi:hypothetical protein